MIDSVCGGCVIAGAGAGKTTATVRAHEDSENRGSRTIVITFTNAAVTDYIRRCNQTVRPDFAEASVNVFTFHKLASAIISCDPDTADNPDSFSDNPDNPDNVDGSEDASMDTVVALAVERVTKRGAPRDFRTVGTILVDESQDASGENYALVTGLAQSTGARVVMIGDPNQNLYRFRNANSRHLLNHHLSAPGMFRTVLATNWRSTANIVALCAPFMRHPTNVSPKPGAEPGRVPRMHVVHPRDLVGRVVERCVDAMEVGTVALIGRSKLPRFSKGKLARMGLQMFVNELERRNIPYVRFFREANGDDGNVDCPPSMAHQKVNVMTIHGSKGLEADSVVLIDILEDIVDGDPAPDTMELMYVAMSRARTRLDLFNSRYGRCDPILRRCFASGLCDVEGDEDVDAVPLTRRSNNRMTVTSMLRDRTIIGETELLDLSRTMCIDPVIKARALPDSDSDMCDLPDAGDLRTLYGHLAENVLQMSHNERSGAGSTRTHVMEQLDTFASARVSIPKRYTAALTTLLRATGARASDTISRDEINRLTRRIRADSGDEYTAVPALLEFVVNKMNEIGRDRVSLVRPSSTQRIPTASLRMLVREFDTSRSTRARVVSLFQACMFFHQLTTHSGYRWGRDYTNHLESFMRFVPRIQAMSKLLPATCEFEQEIFCKPLRISGRADAMSASRIVEFKFSSRLSLSHFMQACMYSTLAPGNFSRRAEVWNLASGERVLVNHTSDTESRWNVFERLSRWTARELIVPKLATEDLEDGRVAISCDPLRMRTVVESHDDVDAAIVHVREENPH